MQSLGPADYSFLCLQRVPLLALEKESVSTIMPNRTEHGGLRGSGLSQGQAETPRNTFLRLYVANHWKLTLSGGSYILAGIYFLADKMESLATICASEAQADADRGAAASLGMLLSSLSYRWSRTLSAGCRCSSVWFLPG